MNDPINQVFELPDGAYLVTPRGIVDYGARWALGYFVGLRPLVNADVTDGTLFGIWTDDEGLRHYDVVAHIHGRQDALDLAVAHNQVAIWDALLNEEVVIAYPVEEEEPEEFEPEDG